MVSYRVLAGYTALILLSASQVTDAHFQGKGLTGNDDDDHSFSLSPEPPKRVTEHSPSYGKKKGCDKSKTEEPVTSLSPPAEDSFTPPESDGEGGEETQPPFPSPQNPTTSPPASSPSPASPPSPPSPSSPPSPPAPAPAPVSGSFGPASPVNAMTPAFAAHLVAHTSLIRQWHNLPSVTWNDELAQKVQAYANTCPGFKHSTLGWENLATFAGRCETEADCQSKYSPVWLWYDKEETMWNYGAKACNTGNWYDCGHFSNLMAPSVSQIGCGASTCGNGNYVWCNYLTPVSNPAVPLGKGPKATLCQELGQCKPNTASFAVEDSTSQEGESEGENTDVQQNQGGELVSSLPWIGLGVGLVATVLLISLVVHRIRTRARRASVSLTPGTERRLSTVLSTPAEATYTPQTQTAAFSTLDIKTPMEEV